MTRWHPDDLAGRLLEQEKTSPQNWHIVNFSAIKDIPQRFPDTCTVEPDWREWGEALCPERFDADELKRTQANIGQSAWLSLFQQRPTDLSGSIWKREWFQTYDPEALNGTKIENVGLDWDTAYTEKEENSATAYIKAGVGSDGKIYVMGFNYDWLEFPEALEWVKELGGPDYIEQKASGKSIVQALRKAQLYAREVPVKGGDKVARTKIVTPLVESGKVLVNKNILNALLDDPRQGILKFKSSQDPGTDVNDAFVQCLNRLRPFVVDKEPEREHSWWGTREVLEEDDPGPASWKDAFRV